MERSFKTLEPRKQFMVLLLCYFAIPVLQGALAIVGSLSHHFPYSWQEFLNTKAEWIGAPLKICSLLVIIRLFMIKEYSVNKKYKIGLILLIAGMAISLLTNIVEIPSGMSFPFTLLEVLTPLVGLILFISASPVDRKTRIFVICTPFITTILAGIMMTSLLSVSTEHYNFAFPAGMFLVEAVIFAVLFILSRKQSCEL